MELECSVWIEAKLFELRSRGRGVYCIVEKCRKFKNAIYLCRDAVVWLAKAVENCSNFSGNRAPYQTRREGNRAFLIQLCQNSYSRFVKLSELGTSKGRGIIAIPEGRNRSGWEVFVRKIRELVGSNSSVLVSENRGVSNNGAVIKASKGKEVQFANSQCGVSSFHETPYLSALKVPVQESSGPSKVADKNYLG